MTAKSHVFFIVLHMPHRVEHVQKEGSRNEQPIELVACYKLFVLQSHQVECIYFQFQLITRAYFIFTDLIENSSANRTKLIIITVHDKHTNGQQSTSEEEKNALCVVVVVRDRFRHSNLTNRMKKGEKEERNVERWWVLYSYTESESHLKMRSHNKTATKSESDDSKRHQYDTRKTKKKTQRKEATILYFEPIRNNNGYNMTRNDT